MFVRRVRGVPAGAGRAALSDVPAPPPGPGADPRLLFDLLLLPGRSAGAVAREARLRQPASFAAFFRGRPVSAPALRELLAVQAARGDAAGARDSLARLRALADGALSWPVLNTALAAAARAGDAPAFEALRAEGAAAGLGAGDEFTFASAAKCYMKAGQPERALDTVRQAREAGVAANEVLYGALLSGFAQLGDFESAETVWAYLKTRADAPPLDSVLYTSMIHACGKAGQAERALMLLAEMQEDGLVPTEVTYNAALFAAARRLDMWREAKALFSSMQTLGMQPSSYTFNTLLMCAARAGDVGSCRKIVADMRSEEEEHGFEMVSRRTLNTLISGLSRAVRQAPPGAERSALVKEAEAVAEEVEQRWGADVYCNTALLSVYTAGHFLQRAEKCFARLEPEPPLQAHTLMFRMYCETGRPQKLQDAWEACQRQESIEPDALAYKWVIQGFARAYWVKSGIAAVRQMIEAGLYPTKSMLQLLRQRCREEDLRKNRWDLETMLKEAVGNQEQKLRRQENKTALMMQKLAGQGVRPFLLPFPLEKSAALDKS